MVVYLPLWKIWVRQLGWNSQYMENKIHVPNHQPDVYIYIYTYCKLTMCVCVCQHTAYEPLSETRKGHPCCLLLGLSLAPICHCQVCFTEGKRMFLPYSKHFQLRVLSNGLNPSMGVSKMGNTIPNVNLIWQMNKSMNFGTLYSKKNNIYHSNRTSPYVWAILQFKQDYSTYLVIYYELQTHTHTCI